MEDMAEPYNEIEDAAYKPKRKKKRKALSRDEVQSIVSTAVKDAIDFIESEIAPSRVKAQQYFKGGRHQGPRHRAGGQAVADAGVPVHRALCRIRAARP
jgi:hypothetical protein